MKSKGLKSKKMEWLYALIGYNSIPLTI